MSKNLTPLQLSILSSFIISIVFTIICLILNLYSVQSVFYHLIIYFLSSFVISFIVILIVLDRFIYRKIKLIYKSIHALKSSSESKDLFQNITKDVMSDMQTQVADWSKQYQAEMFELKKMEKYRREFLTNVSHELKTPLFNIQGYLETLVLHKLKDTDVNLKYLQKAIKNIEHISEIINDLDAISKLETGEQPLNLTTFDITLLVKEIIESFEYQANLKHITIAVKEGCNQPFFVFADEDKIRRVLNNLVTNSIKYGIENGKTFISIYDMAENILVEVSDNGIGIEQEHISRLFDRFYRIDKNRDRKDSSSGLGLAIVKHIIEAHGQTINVRSKIGTGSTFGFTLRKAAKNKT